MDTMKKMIVTSLVVALAFGFYMSSAKDRKMSDMLTTTVFVTDIHCEQCKAKIMNNIPVLGKGIEDVVVDVPTKQVTVVYDARKNSDTAIVKGFTKIKVTADPVKEN